MAYKTNLLNHARAVYGCAPRFGLKATIDLLNFQLTLTGRNLYYNFFPQFIGAGQDGDTRYSPTLRDETRGFIGWLPYFNKKWPLATDKLLFKEFCIEKGLRTPQYWTQLDASIRDLIIKQRASSFGKGIRGPFKAVDSAEAEHRLLDKEYYEQFIVGTIGKAWYWDDKLVCLEMLKMPTVTGDGKRSLNDLIARKARKSRRARRAPEPDKIAALARYQGLSIDSIVPADRKVIVDFRYVSGLHKRKNRKSSNVLPKYAETDIAKQFSHAGRVLWSGIPEDIRKRTLWTVDAIVEEEAGRVWFLEMNCNPIVHPDAYFSMFEGFFGPAEAAVAPIVETHSGNFAGITPAGMTGVPGDAPPAMPMPPGKGQGMPPQVR